VIGLNVRLFVLFVLVVLIMDVAIVTIDWLLLMFVLWFWIGYLYVNNCIGDDCVGGWLWVSIGVLMFSS